MRQRIWSAVFLASVVAAVSFAQTVVNQGKPGNQGPWPVTSTGGTVSIEFDGGFIGYVSTQPCRQMISTNDAGVGTSAAAVPGTGAAGRIWIRICNSVLNASSSVCICSPMSCPQSVALGALGDPLATGDCVTYPIGRQDGGVPCCICNGAGTFLPATECLP